MYVFMHVKCKHCVFMWMHVFQPPVLTFPHAGTYIYSHASPATHGYHPLKEPTMPIWLLQRVWKENEAKEKASNEVQESDVSSSSDETYINSRDKECVHNHFYTNHSNYCIIMLGLITERQCTKVLEVIGLQFNSQLIQTS